MAVVAERSPRSSGKWLLIGAVGLMTAAVTTFFVAVRDETKALPPGSLGMFVGFDRGDRFAQVERELGRPLDLVVTMMDSTSAGAMRSSAWGQFAKSGAYLPNVSGRVDVVVTVPLAFGGGGQSEAAIRENLRATAAGRWDADFRLVAQHVRNAGYGDAVIRLGHEFDAHFPPWSSRNNSAEYIAAFRHVHDVLASESSGFRFDWTATRAAFRAWGPPAYPGDAYVDVIGLDTYWRESSEISDREWTLQYEAVLQAHLDFARSRNKPVSYPEWGRANADTARYIALMHGWFVSLPASGGGRLLYQAYFNPVGQTTYDLNNLPTVKRTYLDTFRGWGSGAQAPATTVPKPAPTTTVPKPAPTTTVPKPAPTTTVPKPAPTTTVPKPAPTTTVPKPAPTTTVPKPVGTTTGGLATVDGSATATRLSTTDGGSAGTLATSAFAPGSKTEASVRLTRTEAGLHVKWAHPSAKAFIVRYQPEGARGWKWLARLGSSNTSTTLDLDPSLDVAVEVIAYVYPAWRTWNGATIGGAPE